MLSNSIIDKRNGFVLETAKSSDSWFAIWLHHTFARNGNRALRAKIRLPERSECIYLLYRYYIRSCTKTQLQIFVSFIIGSSNFPQALSLKLNLQINQPIICCLCHKLVSKYWRSRDSSTLLAIIGIKKGAIRFSWFSDLFFNPFQASVSFLYPLKTVKNSGFLMFLDGIEWKHWL